MTISLLAGALRYLGLTKPVAARMLDVPYPRLEAWASGKTRPARHVWPRLMEFAELRRAELRRLGPCSLEDAQRLRATLTAPPPGFPSLDSYVTLLAEAVLMTAVREAESDHGRPSPDAGQTEETGAMFPSVD